MKSLGELCRRRDILLISDEVYRAFCYDRPFASPASWNEDVLVVDGFSKAYGMTGWRLGYAHGPSRLIQEMAKLQQFSFVCAPAWPSTAESQPWTTTDRTHRGLQPQARHGGRGARATTSSWPTPKARSTPFRAPWGTGTEFVAEAIKNNLLIIPGNVFSQRDTHFRISYAVDDATLRRGLELLRKLARSRSA